MCLLKILAVFGIAVIGFGIFVLTVQGLFFRDKCYREVFDVFKWSNDRRFIVNLVVLIPLIPLTLARAIRTTVKKIIYKG